LDDLLQLFDLHLSEILVKCKHFGSADPGGLFWGQWRTQKSFMGVHCVVHGGHLYLQCAVCDVTILRHIHVSKPTFWRSLLTQYAYYSARALFILYVIALNINYERSKLGYQRKRHSTLWHAVHTCKNIRLCVKTGM